MMKQIIFLGLLTFGPVFGLANVGASEIMFEGYYKISLENKPIGYVIQRYEFDPAKKQFISTSFQRAKLGGKIVQESLKAFADDKFRPLSYQYTAQVGDEIKVIDGTFKGEIMKLMITDGKKTARNETYKNPKGTFLSSFLVYIMMQKKLALNEAFKYSAIAEEDGSSTYGTSWLETKEDKGGYVLFRVLNSFKGEKYASNLAVVPDPKSPDHFIKGEVLGTISPVKNVSTELMASPAQATEGQMVPNKVLITLFGNMPTGKLNMVSHPLETPATAAAKPLLPASNAPATLKTPTPPAPDEASKTLPRMIPSPVPAHDPGP